MGILKTFGLESLVDQLLAANGVHNLRNLLSLRPEVHILFDNLSLWFEGTEEVRHQWDPPDSTDPTCAQPNRYTVCVSHRAHEKYLRMFEYLHVDGDRLYVTFTSSHENARLPDPMLLALHAACARVVGMSGAAEAINELERDLEETRVLAFDGSSARLLDHLITPFAIIPGVA